MIPERFSGSSSSITRHSRALLAAIAVALILLLPPLLQANPIPTYFVVVGEHADRASATRQANMLPLHGIDDFEIVADPSGIHRVVIGGFRYHPDAWPVRQFLVERGFGSSTIESVVGYSESLKSSEVLPESTRMLAPPASRRETNEWPRLEHASRQAVDSIVVARETQQAISEVYTLYSSIPDADPQKGYAAMRLAYLSYRAQDAVAARQFFEQVASGKIASDEEMWVECAGRLARIVHAQKDRRSSWQVWNEYLDVVQDPVKRSTAQIELCGLIFEFYKDENTGTLPEVRRYIEDALAEMPLEHKYSRAMVELMHLETYFYEGEYEKCVENAYAYVDRYDRDPVRQVAMALCFLGVALHKLERNDEALAALETVMDLPLGPADRWRDIPDMKVHAQKWIDAIEDRRHSLGTQRE